jgi:hypothetical protein
MRHEKHDGSFDGKTQQICFKTLFYNFSFPISMGMISSAEMQLSSLEPEQFLPKITSEIWISVRYNTTRHAMKFDDIIHETLSHYGCGEWVLKRK